MISDNIVRTCDVVGRGLFPSDLSSPSIKSAPAMSAELGALGAPCSQGDKRVRKSSVICSSRNKCSITESINLPDSVLVRSPSDYFPRFILHFHPKQRSLKMNSFYASSILLPANRINQIPTISSGRWKYHSGFLLGKILFD